MTSTKPITDQQVSSTEQLYLEVRYSALAELLWPINTPMPIILILIQPQKWNYAIHEIYHSSTRIDIYQTQHSRWIWIVSIPSSCHSTLCYVFPFLLHRCLNTDWRYYYCQLNRRQLFIKSNQQSMNDFDTNKVPPSPLLESDLRDFIKPVVGH